MTGRSPRIRRRSLVLPWPSPCAEVIRMPQGSEARPRTDMHGLLVCAHVLLVSWVLGFPVSRAWGYRPFVSTDAAVVDRQEVEIELGYFTLERTQDENTLTIPSLVLNYGLL